MTKLTFVLFMLLIVTACNNHKQKKEEASKIHTTRKADSTQIKLPIANYIDTLFKLDFFTSFPDTIDGCSSYFTYDSIKVESEKYIFLSDFADLALIKIAGNEIYLHRDSLESKELSDNRNIDVYKGNGVKAILNTKVIKTIDELNYYEGTLEIISDKVKAKFKVHGEGGC